MSESLQSHRLQDTRLPCPSLSPGVCSDSCPLTRWGYQTISLPASSSPLSSLFPGIRIFSSMSALLTRWPKYWNFSFNNSLSNEYLGLISFRIDWFDLLAVQGTLKSLSPAPQFESINFSVLSLLYSPTLTSIYDYWKNHSFDYMDLFWQWYLCFLIWCLGLPWWRRW